MPKVTMLFKTHTRLITVMGFCALLVLMSLMINIALRQLQSLNTSMADIVEETNVKTESANTMRDSIHLRANSLMSMALTKDVFVRDEEYMRYLDHARSYREAREKIITQQISLQELKIHEKIVEATRIAQPVNDHAAELLLSDAEGNETSAAVADAIAHQKTLLVLLNDLVDLERASAELSLMSASDRYDESRRMLFIFAGIAMTLGLFMAALIIRSAALKNRHIYYQANYDELTGLLNRRAFEREFEMLYNISVKTKSNNVLLYLDLDQFKIINDTCGHMAGDELLCQVTEVFRKLLRKTDVLARIGGDEFGVLLKDCNVKDATRIAESIRDAAENYHFTWLSREFSVGVSIGVVPMKHDSGSSMATIMSTADMACLEAKNTGRNRVRVADIDDQQIVERRCEMDSVGLIKQALEEDRLTLYCQLVVPVRGDIYRPDHVEILVRMIGLDGELIQPNCFIPVAERYGLMCSVDKWVVKHAIQWLDGWKHRRAPPKLMINLSGQSVCDESFLDYVMKVLDSSVVRPGSICFEITETAAIANLDKAVAFINALKTRGCEFALDDFGSGLSSFTYLKRLPVDYLKIDGAFVKEIVDGPIDYAMVKSINEIGHVMDKQTIAEFVENDAILKLLEGIGVNYAQGYGIDIPQPLDDFATRAYRRVGKDVARRADDKDGIMLGGFGINPTA